MFRWQKKMLKKAYKANPFPDIEKLKHLNGETWLPEEKIKVWFANQRAYRKRRVERLLEQTEKLVRPTPILTQILSMAPLTSSPTIYMNCGSNSKKEDTASIESDPLE